MSSVDERPGRTATPRRSTLRRTASRGRARRPRSTYRMATGAFAAQRLRQRPRLVHQRGRRHDAVDQADPQRLGGVDHAAAEDEFQRPALAHQPRQALRAGEAGHQAELDLGLAELRGVGREPQRAGHRQLAAAAQGEAVDRGDDGLAQLLDQVEDAAARVRACALAASGVSVASSLMSAPATNAFSPAPVRMTTRTDGVGAQRAACLAQFRQRGGVERVEHRRPVDRDGGDGPVDGDEEVFVGHRVTCSRARLYPTPESRPPRRTRPARRRQRSNTSASRPGTKD